MDKRTLYWIWLSLCFSWGSDHASEILSQCGDIETFYNYSEREKTNMGIFKRDELKNVLDGNLDKAKKIVFDCEKLNIGIVTIEDELYPKRLRSIYGAPPVLYYVGDISGIDDAVVISIVGTRDAVEYTKNATIKIASDLAHSGAIVVSGCAVGIDAAAHYGALKGKGRTIGVLGCGIDKDYPKENYLLKKEILKRGGALISELPPGTGVYGQYFPVRNRIIAGLSLGVLLTHTPVRSGSLITAEHALEQGKEVYCLPPCDIFDSEFMGVMKFIRDGSAVIANAEDILMDFYFAYSDKLLKNRLINNYIDNKKQYDKAETNLKEEKKSHARSAVSGIDEESIALLSTPENYEAAEDKNLVPTVENKPQNDMIEWDEEKEKVVAALDERQRTIYDLLSIEPKTADDVSIQSGIPTHEVLSVLTDFEINGVVQSFSGLKYARIHI